MAEPKIIDFKDIHPVREESLPAAEKLISGTPHQITENVYESRNERVFTGFWSSEVGKWRVNYDGEEEFCHLLEGEIELVGNDGSVKRFSAGDRFVVPEGFSGTWETIKACRKLYVIALQN